MSIAGHPPETPTGPALGSVFPDFSLPDQHGRPISLTTGRAGRAALVVVFRSAVW